MLASAGAFRTLANALDFGLSADNVSFDFSKVVDRKDRIVSEMTGPRLRAFLTSQGFQILDGSARFVSDHEVEADGERVSFDNAVIATGSTPFVPPIEGLDDVGYITSDEALNLKTLPASIIIVGGSAVGLEFATVYNSFGSKVTVVEAAQGIASKSDYEISATLHAYMEEWGVDIRTKANAKRAFKENGLKALVIETADGEVTLKAHELFIATGRRPVLEDLNLEGIGLAFGKKGIEVNEYLQTSVGNIYAAGDAIPTMQLAQTAAYEGDLAGLNAFSDIKTAADYRVMPSVIWSYPEIADVGKTEDQTKEEGLDYITEKLPFRGLARAFADNERKGFVKVIASPNTGELLGLHIIGNHADELVHEGVLAMTAGMPASQLAEAIHCELTMAEGVGDAFIGLYENINQRKRRAA